ncbi:MAG: M50 family metallopeptidase [Defluviitaleaceae bacterium]|nr:M50 family metallopeptidase [Defluviitaleaceae bacterium]
MNTVIPILIFILILSVVIFIHELGHYLAARHGGIFVEEFALGMGPKVLGFKGKKKSLDGETTLYSLRLFPIGGFCKMRGMDGDVPDDPEALNNKSIKARTLVMAGGSMMNFFLAFALFFLWVMLHGYHVAEVAGINTEMPGYRAGLRTGDRITHINGARIGLYEDFIFMLDASGGHELDVRVNRNGERLNFAITPERRGDSYFIGFNPGRRFGLLHERPADPSIPFQRVRVHEGLRNSAEMILFHVRAPFRLLARWAAGDPMPEDAGIMGPIGIGGLVTEMYQEIAPHGFLTTLMTMLFITALINAALGVMNLLPIPAMDGARLVFLAIEAVRRKPVPPEKEAMVHMVGLVAILMLAVFIAYRDIVRLIPGG